MTPLAGAGGPSARGAGTGTGILAGDVGGTNVRLALFDVEGGRLVERRRERYPSSAFAGLEAAIERFLDGARPEVSAAGFGVAGPVRNGRCEATNLPWIVDAGSLASRLGLPAVALVNDLAANALGLSELQPSDFEVLSAGVEDPEGNAALLSAGTGLGEAILVREGAGFRPLPSEGGHCSFAPRDDHESRLLSWLAARHGHVSYERVVSGMGLAELYRFERETSGVPEPGWLAEEISRTSDVGRAVSEAAREGRDGVAERTMERFVRILGSEAGNLCLKALATGGLFLGGGIAPKVLRKLKEGSFLAALADKGRMGPMLARIPVRVVLNDSCALLGAARAAATAATRAPDEVR